MRAVHNVGSRGLALVGVADIEPQRVQQDVLVFVVGVGVVPEYTVVHDRHVLFCHRRRLLSHRLRRLSYVP